MSIFQAKGQCHGLGSAIKAGLKQWLSTIAHTKSIKNIKINIPSEILEESGTAIHFKPRFQAKMAKVQFKFKFRARLPVISIKVKLSFFSSDYTSIFIFTKMDQFL